MTRYVTLLSVVLALALTAALAACGSDEPSGVTGPDRDRRRTPGSGDAPTATDAPVPATATAPPMETDREALVSLYNATDGENWFGRLSDECAASTDDGRVTEGLKRP